MVPRGEKQPIQGATQRPVKVCPIKDGPELNV